MERVDDKWLGDPADCSATVIIYLLSLDLCPGPLFLPFSSPYTICYFHTD